MTIKQYQEFNRISNLDIEPLDKAIMLVANYEGTTIEEVEQYTRHELMDACKAVQKHFEKPLQVSDKVQNIFRLKGNTYYINLFIDKLPMNTGRYIEVMTYGKTEDEVIKNLHYLMASITSKLKFSWKKFRYVPLPFSEELHEGMAKDFLDMDFSIAYNAAVFFCESYRLSIEGTRDYLAEAMGEKSQEMIQGLLAPMAGLSTPQRWQHISGLN